MERRSFEWDDIEIREDGDLTGWRPAYIAKLTDAQGDPEALVTALLETGWLEIREGRTLIHDWIDFGGRHLKGKYGSGKKSQNIDKLKEIWALHGRVYGKESSGRAPGELRCGLPTEPYHTEPTLPTKGGESTSPAVKIAERLKTLITANDPGAKVPTDIGPWVLEADKLIRLDKRGEDEIIAVMEWALKDSFWRGVILSLRKLRENFTQLKAKSPKGGRVFKEPKCPRCKSKGLDFKPTETAKDGTKVCSMCKTFEENGPSVTPLKTVKAIK